MSDPPEAAAVITPDEARATAANDGGDANEGGGENREETSVGTGSRIHIPPTYDEGEGADDGGGCDDGDGGDYNDDKKVGENDGEAEAAAAAPQAKDELAPSRLSSLGSEGEMVDCRLSPLDIRNQKQNIKDVLTGDAVAPPPLPENSNVGNGGGGSHRVQFSGGAEDDYGHPQSALHQDEFSQLYGEGNVHDPHVHESSLLAGGEGAYEGPPPSSSSSRLENPFKARKKNRLVPSRGSTKGHSHPRKSPFKSEVVRLRHAQQLEREKRQFSKDPPGDDASSTASGRSVGIKDTTAPPETAYFSIQATKLKHSLLHSLGEFLTSAFADDEEASGSYFSQDLLDQLSASNPHLKGVWLQAKSLNDGHIRQLCDALIRNKVVTEVWLPSNHITDEGAAHIAHMLKFNRNVRELFLGGNEIGPKGAAALAGALARGNTTLAALGLGDNRIGVEGAGAFAAALRHNHSLHTLDVKNNGIPRNSSIRSLLNKMLEFNASDPGDESLVMGLQEELAGLVASLPPDAAEEVVMRAEEALKTAMLCRRRGDKVGAAEAEGAFIRICTTGEPPVDPPEERGRSSRQPQQRRYAAKKKRPKKPLEPDRVDGLVGELATLSFQKGPKPPAGGKETSTKASGGELSDDKGGGEPALGSDGSKEGQSNVNKGEEPVVNSRDNKKYDEREGGPEEEVTAAEEEKEGGELATQEDATDQPVEQPLAGDVGEGETSAAAETK